MSRIHEALKRAELERSAQGGASESGITAVPVVELVAAGNTLTAADDAAMPVFTHSSAAESVLDRCPRMHWKPDLTTMLFMNGNDAVKGTEEYRTLRSRLYNLREKMTLKALLVTSALPKEGKSFTAANLAQVLVKQQGRRVLLIDGDLRGPRLHQMLGTTAAPGLSEYLQGDSDEFSIMQRGPLEDLFFIPAGSKTDYAAELVGNGRLKTLLEKVGPLFDWVIVDSPPAIPVSDASVMANACDGVLLVVRSNSTPADAARRARQEFPEQSLIGIILNGTGDDAAPYYRYYNEAYEKKGTRTES